MIKTYFSYEVCARLYEYIWISKFDCCWNDTDDERDFSYDIDSEIGPARWGEIHDEWKDCNIGKMQSPVDMTNERVQIVSHLGRIKRNYRPGNATLINRGHDMMVCNVCYFSPYVNLFISLYDKRKGSFVWRLCVHLTKSEL